MNIPGNMTQMPDLSMVKSFIALAKGQGNLEKSLEGLVKNHPMYQQAMQFAQNNGGSYQDAFYSYAQKNGIDPKQIEDLFK